MATKGDEYILCVDDEYIVLEGLKRELRSAPFFSNVLIETFDNGMDALVSVDEILSEGGVISVVISDQRMPGMTGDAFLEEMKTRSPDTLCILLTGYSDLDAVTRLVNKSALYRFILKPWNRHDLMLTVQEACASYRQKAMLDEKNRIIDRLATILVTTLESANRCYDADTGAHIRRIPLLSGLIARFAGYGEDFIKRITLYSSLHDIGKIGISQDILRKPEKLTPEEFEEIKQHVVIGFKIIDQDEIDAMVKNIILYHHEKWAGGGYMQSLAEGAIPVEARIVALADVFDALISERVYKKAYPVDKALEIIRSERGISFDPVLVDAFLANIDEILAAIGYEPRAEA